MTVDAPGPPAELVRDVRKEPSWLNLPNAITISRLVLALVLFAMIDSGELWVASAIVFIVAASTDFLDGYLARRYGQVTILGRILDPFVDKIIVCGAFVFLVGVRDSGICAWTAFIVLAREMLVTSLRSVLEARGVDFSAQWSGKIKMGVQCVAVAVCLFSLSPGFVDAFPLSTDGFMTFRKITVIATVAITVISGLEYVVRGMRMLLAARDTE